MGAILLTVRRCSLMCICMPAHGSYSAHRLLYLIAVRRTCQTDRSQVGGGPQLLAPRRLLPHEPPVPVGYALAQFGNTAIGLLFSRDLLIRRLCHAHLPPVDSSGDLLEYCSLVRSRWQC